MEGISLDRNLKDKYNKVVLGCLKCTVTVTETPKDLLGEIEKASEELRMNLTIPEIKNRKRISQTRDCYHALGKDPHRYRNSAEAMHRRILQGKGLYKINSVVDACNLVSVKTGFSLGAYDVSKIHGGVVWSVTPDGAHYKGIGKEDVNIERLPALKDDEGFFGNPTSDSVRTMVTEEAEKILLCIYGFGGSEGLEEALREAERLLKTYCSAENVEMKII